MKKVLAIITVVTMLFLVGCKDNTEVPGNTSKPSNSGYTPGESVNQSEYANNGNNENNENSEYPNNEWPNGEWSNGERENSGESYGENPNGELMNGEWQNNQISEKFTYKSPAPNQGETYSFNFFRNIKELDEYTIVLNYNGAVPSRYKIVNDAASKAYYSEVRFLMGSVITLKLEDASYILYEDTKNYSVVSGDKFNESGEELSVLANLKDLGTPNKTGETKYKGKECYYEEYLVGNSKTTYIFNEYTLVAVELEGEGVTETIDVVYIDTVAEKNLLKVPEDYKEYEYKLFYED